MGTIASHLTSLTIVYSAVYSGADQRKHQNSTSMAYERGNHRWPVIPRTKGNAEMLPFDDVIMWQTNSNKANIKRQKPIIEHVLIALSISFIVN